ncbi:MAG TPA: ATP-dependent DNA helicase RecG [Candidatus Polarisedimenticolia bacterium]|nr:ATP-dependent DNA helicase RecG [Candidatus Polarisedimenticolia bacterium]
MIELGTPLRYVKGIGPRRAEELEPLGLRTVEDLLLHLPFRYEDRSRFLPIASLVPGLKATVRGRVVTSSLRRTRIRGFSIFEALVEDQSGAIRVLFFNQPYLRTLLAPGREVILYGEATPARHGRRGFVLQSPQVEVLADDDQEAIHTGRVVPIHPRLPGLSPRTIRRLIHTLLAALPETLPDPLPAGLSAARGFPSRRAALAGAHFPPGDGDPADWSGFRTPAHRRLIFEEFFFLQLGFALARRGSETRRRAGAPLRADDAIRERLRAALPFRLTGAQRRVLKEIAADLMSERPMNRLLQGDVGCGKTVVALMAALLAIENGHQAVFMAPTEILAEQHHRSFRRSLEGRGYLVGLLTAGVTGSARRQVLQGARTGAIPLLVGTHALLEEEVAFKSLRLAVIDEQHRFGVAQRARLRDKGKEIDVLVMTATPIPRSLALTLYGDLDLSVIDELPPGRRPVKTVLRGEEKRADVYRFLRAQVAEERQVYVVYPLIEESEQKEVKAAAAMAEKLRRDVFPDLRVGLLHGRLKGEERERVMTDFAAGRTPILVATTVIEVGIDVPNATVMVIEQAERFGLSQLHQLRGRVGRAGHESFCILMAGEGATEEAHRRLEVMCGTNDGFVIARRDLEMRGPGEFLGTRQSGIPDLRVGDILRDHDILEDARKEAFAVAAALPAEPREHDLVRHLRRRWAGRLGMIQVG